MDVEKGFASTSVIRLPNGVHAAACQKDIAELGRGVDYWEYNTAS
jgi:hypothetical protein